MKKLYSHRELNQLHDRNQTVVCTRTLEVQIRVKLKDIKPSLESQPIHITLSLFVGEYHIGDVTIEYPTLEAFDISDKEELWEIHEQ